jgi:hypothetical protein
MKIEIRKVDVCVRKKEDADLCKPLKELQEIVDEYVKDAASQFDEIASDKDAIYQVANIIDNAGLAIKKYGRDEHFITSSKPKITFKCAGGRYQICAQYGIFELNDETEAMECDAVLDIIITTNTWGNDLLNYDDDKSRPTFIRDREKEKLLNASDFCKIVQNEVNEI